MNITCYTHYFTPEIGAPSARIYDLSQKWSNMGHYVQVVTCFPNHPTGKLYPGYTIRRHMQENIAGIIVHRHWTYMAANKGFMKKTLGHVSFLAGHRLFSASKIMRPDVTVGTSPTFFAAMAAERDARKYNIPFVMEVRDLWPAIFVDLGVIKNPVIIRLLEKWELSLYSRASRIVTVTDAFRKNLLERGIPANKVVTITNGADADFWTPKGKPEALAKKLGVERKHVVLYIGAHGISQALGRVLDSAALLKHQE